MTNISHTNKWEVGNLLNLQQEEIGTCLRAEFLLEYSWNVPFPPFSVRMKLGRCRLLSFSHLCLVASPDYFSSIVVDISLCGVPVCDFVSSWAGRRGKTQLNYNSAENQPRAELELPKSVWANIKHLSFSFRIFHKSMDKRSLGVIQSCSDKVQNRCKILLKKGCLVENFFW